MHSPIDQLVAQCRAAQPLWAAKPLCERLQTITRLRRALVSDVDRLCLSVTQDIGRPAHEVLATDVVPTADALRFLEKRAARILRPERVAASLRPWWLWGESETIHRRPLGVVGIIGTWNYPILLNAIAIAQALTAGNGVIWKPSELSPAFAAFFTALVHGAGVPQELFVCLPAEREQGSLLVDADIDHLVFTGSAAVGRKIAARLGERLVPSTLELSGCDALYVLEDADVALAAKAAWFGMTMNAGQTCLAVRRAFVQRRRYEEFVAALRPLAAGARPEPLATLSQATQAERLVRESIAGGARLLDQVGVAAEDDPPRFAPTVVLDARPEMTICREASFAPLLAVCAFDNEGDLPAMATPCPYGLGASIFAQAHSRAAQLARSLKVGSVAINDVIVGTAHPAVGFGGVRASGWGVTRGAEGLRAMTAPQVVTTRRGRFRPHFNAPDPALAATLRGLLQWTHAERFGTRWSGFRQMVAAALHIGKHVQSTSSSSTS